MDGELWDPGFPLLESEVADNQPRTRERLEQITWYWIRVRDISMSSDLA